MSDDEECGRVEASQQSESLWDCVKKYGVPSGLARYVTWEAQTVPRQGRNDEQLPPSSRGEDIVHWVPLVWARQATTTPVSSSSQPAESSRATVQGIQAPDEHPTTTHGSLLDHGAPAVTEIPVVGVNPVAGGNTTVRQRLVAEEHPVLDENSAPGRGEGIDEVENVMTEWTSLVAGLRGELGAVTDDDEASESGHQGDEVEHGIEDVIEGGLEDINFSQEGGGPDPARGTGDTTSG